MREVTTSRIFYFYLLKTWFFPVTLWKKIT